MSCKVGHRALLQSGNLILCLFFGWKITNSLKTSNGSGTLIYAKLYAPLYKKATIKDLLIDLLFFSYYLLKLNLNQGTWSIASFFLIL